MGLILNLDVVAWRTGDKTEKNSKLVYIIFMLVAFAHSIVNVLYYKT
jgi:hypothetical protein